MQTNFNPSLHLVLLSEGGYSNDPHDPGGATNYGITQRTFDAWQHSHGLPGRNVHTIAPSEVAAIYKFQFWSHVRGDDLPLGVDYCIFDFGVESGPIRAVEFMQQAVGVVADGKFGPKTLAAVEAADPSQLIQDVCENRLDFLKGLGIWKYDADGLQNRVDFVQEHALGMLPTN